MTTDRYSNETNNLQDIGLDHHEVDHSRTLGLHSADLVKITRLRLVTDPGCPFWDISYCYGQAKDGALVRVDLGVYQLSRKNMKGDLIQAARRAGRHAKNMGLLDDSVISKLW